MVPGLNGLMGRFFNPEMNRQFLGADRSGQLLSLKDGPCSACRQQAEGSRRSDSVQLSKPLQTLQKSGLDLEKSVIVESSQAISFNFQFIDEHIQGLTSNGFYDRQSQSLQIDFSFSSALTTIDPNTGEQGQEFFEFEFHLEASQVQTFWGEGEVDKDDILQFARRILDKTSELKNEGKKIDGLKLDERDFNDFKARDHRRLLKGLMRIMNLMRKIERMQEKNAEPWMQQPQRDESASAAALQLEAEQKFSFSLNVTRLDTIGNGQTGGPEQSPDAPL